MSAVLNSRSRTGLNWVRKTQSVPESVLLGVTASLRPLQTLSVRQENLWHERKSTVRALPPSAAPLGSPRGRSGAAWSRAQFGTVQTCRVWLRTEQVVRDSRSELTSKPPQEQETKRERRGGGSGGRDGGRDDRVGALRLLCQREDGGGDLELVGGCEQGGRDKGSAACLQASSLCASLW